jgi:1,4-dihydroxy-2-naphthoyl-CoA hydrolase
MTDSDGANIDVKSALIERLGIRILQISPDRCRGTMPVEGNTQLFGVLHGGASAALAETVGSLAAMAHAGDDRIAVGVDLSITHHAAVESGLITAEAVALHLGRSVATYDIALFDDSGRRNASARLTCYLRNVSATHNRNNSGLD